MRFAAYCSEPGDSEVVVKFVRGEGYVTDTAQLGIIRALGCVGDYYRLRPLHKARSQSPATSTTVKALSSLSRQEVI